MYTANLYDMFIVVSCLFISFVYLKSLKHISFLIKKYEHIFLKGLFYKIIFYVELVVAFVAIIYIVISMF